MKKRLFATILAFSTVVSGRPVNAAEVPEEYIADTVDEEEHSDVLPDISKETKMAGSNGVLYDNVSYLSTKTVMALEEDTRKVYRDVCDEIASYKETGYELKDVVLAADAEGALYFSVSIPSKVLDDIQNEMIQEVQEKPAMVVEGMTLAEADSAERTRMEERTVGERNGSTGDSVTEESAGESNGGIGGGVAKENADKNNGTIEDGATKDDAGESNGSTEEDTIKVGAGESTGNTEDGATKEDTEENTGSKEDAATGGDTGETTESTGDSVTGEDTDGRDESAEEDITQGDADEKKENAEEDKPEENPENSESAGEDGKTEENASEKEESITEEDPAGQSASEDEAEGFTDENLEMLPDFAEETFDVIETVKADAMIDLGYGSGSGQVQIYTIAPSGYFYDQLTAEEKKIYNAAKPKFTGGSTSFSVQIRDAGSFSWNPVCHAVSAIILTYPDKTDWMARPGYIHARGSYLPGSSMVNYTISYDKSKYYSSSLNADAKTQIQMIANAAQQYAAESYPGAPVYGIVKYFDTWICENNYYEMLGAMDNIRDQPADVKKIYYYCHSAYGILLNGYGVCEGYARAMSRLLDAIGIPNLYVLGDTSGGFHAWNYVQMPDGKWYLTDSTWNDSTDPGQTWSRDAYLLISDDGDHVPTGGSWSEERNFDFPSLAATSYTPSTESISFETAIYNLKPNEKETIQVSGMDYIRNSPKTWSSSDTKVAKVDNNGKITAVAPGKATITLAAAGMAASCEVSVYQVKSVTSASTNKNSDTLSFGITGTQGTSADAKSVVLNVNMGNSPYDAEWMIANGKASEPVITYTNKKTDIATVNIERIEQNQITLKIKPNTAGSTNVKVTFAGKTTTIKVSVGRVLPEEWFSIERIEGDRTPYTGKAIKPKVKKITREKVTYKVSYLNNKNVGTASVKITGSGKFGGDIIYHFEITPIDITDAVFSRALKDKIYNGGANAPATTVKLGKKTLRANTDYTILYDGREMETIPAGTYTISVRGKGNYTGTAASTQYYTVKQNTIAKVTASCPGTVKYTGRAQDPVTARIGRNILPESDYTVVYHIGSSKNGKEIGKPLAKGSYTAVITVKGSNLTTTAKKTEIIKRFTVK